MAVIDLDFLSAIANSASGDTPIERPRTLVKLTQDAGTADRGEVDIQMTLVRERVALMDPVGNARDPPNKVSFIDASDRLTRGRLLGPQLTDCLRSTAATDRN